MQRVLRKIVYDTETATLIKKVVVGAFGDPAGYEESLYQNVTGHFFLYTNGGAESKYPTENISCMSKEKAELWLEKNA